MELGSKINILRKEKGMTQENLANMLNVSNQSVSKWEAGQCCPDIQLIPEIADIFGITIDELFGRNSKDIITETDEKSGAGKCVNALPWNYDDTLRIVAYKGHTLLQKEECEKYNDVAVHFHISETMKNDVECDFDLYCADVKIEGNVTCNKSLSCGSVTGDSVNIGYVLNCNEVSGTVNVGNTLNCQDVTGNVNAGNVINCDDIQGNATSGNEIACSNINGDVMAGGNIACCDINGDVSVKGYLECSDINGDITAEQYVECGDVEGSVNAGQYISCGDIGGDATAAQGIECGDIGGNVTAGQFVECGEVNGEIKQA